MVTTSVGSPHLAATSDRVDPSTTSLVPQRNPSARAGVAAHRPSTRRAAARCMVPTIGRSGLTGNEQSRRQFAVVTMTAANLFRASRHSLFMGPPRQWMALALVLGPAMAFTSLAAEVTLTPAEVQRVAARGIVIKATLDATQRRGTVRAAIRIDAPA